MAVEVQQFVTRHAALYFKNETLKIAAHEALNPKNPFYQEEFDLLRLATHHANTHLCKDPYNKKGVDLVNINLLLQSHALNNGLPTIAVCDTPQDFPKTAMKIQIFLNTLQTMNQEIASGYYQNPKRINNGSPRDVVRFYLLDTYSRWVAIDGEKNNPFSQYAGSTSLEREREFANTVVNAICEGAVVGAEQNDSAMVELVTWMVSQDWIEEKWGFTPYLVARAIRAAANSSL